MEMTRDEQRLKESLVTTWGEDPTEAEKYIKYERGRKRKKRQGRIDACRAISLDMSIEQILEQVLREVWDEIPGEDCIEDAVFGRLQDHLFRLQMCRIHGEEAAMRMYRGRRVQDGKDIPPTWWVAPFYHVIGKLGFRECWRIVQLIRFGGYDGEDIPDGLSIYGESSLKFSEFVEKELPGGLILRCTLRDCGKPLRGKCKGFDCPHCGHPVFLVHEPAQALVSTDV